jgi:hypothetical protein
LRNPHVEKWQRFKIPAKDIQDQEQANARALKTCTRQNNELSAIISLEDAKAVLSIIYLRMN